MIALLVVLLFLLASPVFAYAGFRWVLFVMAWLEKQFGRI